MFTYRDYDIDTELTTYEPDGNIRLELYVADTKYNAKHDDFIPGEPWATLSVDVPNYSFGTNEIVLNLYQNPDFVLDLLSDYSFFHKTGKSVHLNGLEYPVVVVSI